MYSRGIGALCLFSIVIMLSGIGVSNSIAGNSSTPNQSAENVFSLQLNSTRVYVDMVNSSSYLFFYPDLKESYTYLNESASIYKTNSSMAYLLLGLARSFASSELSRIDSYRAYSLAATVAAAAIFTVVLYLLMRPSRGNKRKDYTSKQKPAD